MLTLSKLQLLFDKYNVGPSKRFGQNFLIDQNILKNIIKVSNSDNKDVIEIGPGMGSLTHYLLENSKTVTSYEIDEDMIRVLRGEIEDEKFELIEGDFLRQELNWEGKKTVVANIPYNITTDIIFKLFENSEKVDQATLMVQKEVAKRITSKPGDKDYGKLAISAMHFADVKYEFTVGAKAFLPAPKVDSAIMTMKFKEVDMDFSNKFLKFVKLSFSMRRKTLLNNFKNFMDPEQAKTIIEKVSKNPSIRPQELSYEQFIEMYKLYTM